MWFLKIGQWSLSSWMLSHQPRFHKQTFWHFVTMAASHHHISIVDNADIKNCDVIFGRGANCAYHVGSIALKVAVVSKLESYFLATSPQSKTLITLDVVNSIKLVKGRFFTNKLPYSMASGISSSMPLGEYVWYEVSSKEARLKVRELFRDCIKSIQREGPASILLSKLGVDELVNKVLPFDQIVHHIANSSSIRNRASAARKRLAKKTTGNKASSGCIPHSKNTKSLSIGTIPTSTISVGIDHHFTSHQVDVSTMGSHISLLNQLNGRSTTLHDDTLLSAFPISASCSRLDNKLLMSTSCSHYKPARLQQRMLTNINQESEMFFHLNESRFDLLFVPASVPDGDIDPLSSNFFANERDDS